MINDIEIKKKAIIEYANSFKPIAQYFGSDFINRIIKDYKFRNSYKEPNDNYILANFLFSHYPLTNSKINFYTEFSKMLFFYNNEFNEFINSPDVKARLTSKDNSLFQGKWSEIIFAYFLAKNNIKVININPKELKK